MSSKFELKNRENSVRQKHFSFRLCVVRFGSFTFLTLDFNCSFFSKPINTLHLSSALTQTLNILRTHNSSARD